MAKRIEIPKHDLLRIFRQAMDRRSISYQEVLDDNGNLQMQPPPGWYKAIAKEINKGISREENYIKDTYLKDRFNELRRKLYDDEYLTLTILDDKYKYLKEYAELENTDDGFELSYVTLYSSRKYRWYDFWIEPDYGVIKVMSDHVYFKSKNNLLQISGIQGIEEMNLAHGKFPWLKVHYVKSGNSHEAYLAISDGVGGVVNPEPLQEFLEKRVTSDEHKAPKE